MSGKVYHAGGMLSLAQVLREFLVRYPRQFGLLSLLLIVEGVVAASSVLALVPLADFLLDPQLRAPSRITQFLVKAFATLGLSPGFWLFGMFFVGLHTIKNLVEVAIRYAVLLIKHTVGRGLIDDVLSVCFRARWSFFSGTEGGVLMNTLSKEYNAVGDALGGLATLIADAIKLVIYLAVPVWLNSQVTLSALGLAVLFSSPFIYLHRVSYRLGTRNTETANTMMAVLTEILGAARLILGFGRQSQARARYLQAFDASTRSALRLQVLWTAMPKVYQPLGMLAAVIGVGFTQGQQVPMSELAAVMWSLLAAIPILSSLLQGRISLASFLPSYEQLLRLQRSAAEFGEVAGTREFARLELGIEFVDVSFTYPGREKTLDCVNLQIRKGCMTALVGESGSGKSTVTDLVLGLQIPQSGSVLIDGQTLCDWRQNSLREHVGYVPQDPLLFHSSVRDNLLWSCATASEANLWEALSLANAADFVRELPQGIDTYVGDRGVRLSGGQIQRIALARALVRKPQLLILDEATSALDSESEKLIQQSIDKVAAQTTILVVAHRLSTIVKADHIYVMRRGRVVEDGSFKALSKDPGSLLAAMVEAQRMAGRNEET
jgi:ABC-type multidrug transport system fused ATPase/permease subunit